MPFISILIPAYKAGRFIGRALEGVRAQTHADWEVVVVEDGTHDETEAVVCEFAASVPQPVRYENNAVNRGVSTTRNRAMALARGGVFAFLDADDQWTPAHLASGLSALERGADLCFSGFRLHDVDAGTFSEPPLPDVAAMRDPLVRLFESNFIQTSSLVMVRAATARRAGEFDTSLKVGEDCDYWMRMIAQGGRLACTGERTCVYTKHGESAMAKTLMVAEHSVKFYRAHLADESLPSALRRRFFARSLCNYGRLVRGQDARLARSLFLEAWKTTPWDWRCLAFAAAACVRKG